MSVCAKIALSRRLALAVTMAAVSIHAGVANASPPQPPRRADIAEPPALVALTGLSFGEPRAPLEPPFAIDAAPAANWLDTRARLAPRGADAGDFAWSMLDETHRELAFAVDDWAAERRGISAERRRLRAELAQNYAARGFVPYWIESGQWRASVAPAVARLARAGDDGLDLRAYAMPSAEKPAPSARDELALSEAVAAYALQARGSRIEPERLSHLIGAVTTLPDPGKAVAEVADADFRAGDVLQGFNPTHYGYQQLREKLIELRTMRVSAPAVDDQLLAVATDPLSDAPPPGHGKRARPAPQTTSSVEAEVIANMERWRWLPRDLGDPRIEVNIPDFELALVRDGQVAHRTKVIVGKETTPTPIFSDQMEEIIVNPSWYVPQSIIKKEWGGSVGKGYQVSTRRGEMVVRQPPGERNALGRVKFVFPNDFAVYMHDTPQRGLFSETHRAFSHGCMRVFEPFALAEAVLGPGNGWSEARIKKMIGPSERYITLEKKLPVHIEYFTAYVDEVGQLVQRPDLYGYSARVRRALGLGG